MKLTSEYSFHLSNDAFFPDRNLSNDAYLFYKVKLCMFKDYAGNHHWYVKILWKTILELVNSDLFLSME